MQRYPNLDLDLMVERYKNRVETIMTLQQKGWSLKHYLKTIGVLRSYLSDCSLMAFIKPWMNTEAEVKQAMADHLVNRFRKASPEVRFQGYLNRDLARLKNEGHEDLVPAVTVLKTIKFVQKQLVEARGEPATEASPDTSLMSE